MSDWWQVLDPLHSTTIAAGSIVARLVCAALLGLIIGLDREYRSRPAGLRTHMLVALAAGSFGVIAFEITGMIGEVAGARLDPTRVIEAVTAGVAFLAAGTIIRGERGVRGLTTGAGMWLAGAIGLACGVGAYFVAIVATVLGFLILTVLRALEKRLPGKDEE